MKKLCVMVNALILLFSSGCQKYDYKEEQPVGVMAYEVEPEANIVNSYTGDYVKVTNTPWIIGSSYTYSDKNVTVCNSELRYSVAILNIYYTGNNILQDFVLNFNVYDKDYNLLGESSCNVYLAGGFMNSIILDVPEGAFALELVDYYGNCIDATGIKFYEFNETVIQKSQSYYDNNTEDLLLLLDKDNVVVDWCNNSGVYISGRVGIEKYGIVEVP